jgi:hypothetical protein
VDERSTIETPTSLALLGSDSVALQGGGGRG